MKTRSHAESQRLGELVDQFGDMLDESPLEEESRPGASRPGAVVKLAESVVDGFLTLVEAIELIDHAKEISFNGASFNLSYLLTHRLQGQQEGFNRAAETQRKAKEVAGGQHSS